MAGKYALEQVIGEGGMGAVFCARNTLIDMPVAIKLIRADLNRAVFSGRLLREARAAAKLQHAAIVRVFDVGQTALGDPFIVMELLSGETLASLLDREGRLSTVRAAQLLLPIADALVAAHAKGFVHRDVKPDNVFLAVSDEQQQPKLVDFGIVKLEQSDRSSRLTQVGALLGSPDYMSPEQARGLDVVDLRSDVWSLSIMLYEAIAGHTPFEASNYNALLRLIVEQEPPSLEGLGAADAELSAIVARGMAKEAGRRYESMTQLGAALARWLISQGVADDVCGVSLSAKWSHRTSDRQARSVGKLSPRQLPHVSSSAGAATSDAASTNAPTLAIARAVVAPGSIHPTSHTTPPPSQRSYRGVAVAGVVAVGVLLWWCFPREPPRSAPVTASAHDAVTQPLALPAEPPTSVVSSVASAVPPAAPVGSNALGKPGASRPGNKINLHPTGNGPIARTPANATKPAANSDLLSPY